MKMRNMKWIDLKKVKEAETHITQRETKMFEMSKTRWMTII